MAMAKKLPVAALVVAGVATLFNIISVATDYWAEGSVPSGFPNGTVSAHFGLWSGYLEEETNTTIEKASHKLKAARGMTLLPLIMAVPSKVLLGLSMRSEGIHLHLIAMFSLITQAVFLAGGLVAANSYFNDYNTLSLGWSAHIAVVSCILYFAAGLLPITFSYFFGHKSGYTSFSAGDDYKS